MIERPPHIALLRAISFAAEKHRDQRRKGADASPYINHPIAVARIVAEIGGVEDVATLKAAILHDIIEDTNTTPAELEREFGAEVSGLVLEVTDDKTLEKQERKRRQIEHAPHLSERAKLIKIADKIANPLDVTHAPPDWPLWRRIEYLDWAAQVVEGCRGANEKLEGHFDAVLARGREALSGKDEQRQRDSEPDQP